MVAMNVYRKQSLRRVPCNQLKSENIETFHLLSTLKEPMQIDYKEACSGTSMNINIRLIYLLKTSLTRSLGKMCSYSELFWSVFLRIRTE